MSPTIQSSELRASRSLLSLGRGEPDTVSRFFEPRGAVLCDCVPRQCSFTVWRPAGIECLGYFVRRCFHRLLPRLFLELSPVSSRSSTGWRCCGHPSARGSHCDRRFHSVSWCTHWSDSLSILVIIRGSLRPYGETPVERDCLTIMRSGELSLETPATLPGRIGRGV